MSIHYKPGYYEALTEDEQKAVFAEYRSLGEDPRARGGEQLEPVETATTVRVQDGRTLASDGPYADTRRCSAPTSCSRSTTIDEAIELAARIPAARLGGAIEVRPLVER
jgi:hypothetical protein